MNPGAAAAFDPACWARAGDALRQYAAAFTHEIGAIEGLVALLVFAVGGAVLLAWPVQRFYARRMVRLMSFREVAPPPEAWWARRAPRRQQIVDAAAPVALPEAVARRARRLRRATLAAWAVLTLGSFALLPLFDDLSALDHALLPVLVGLLGAGPALVNLRPQGSKPLLLAAVIAGVVLAITLDPAGAADADAWLGAAVVVGVPYLVSVHRTLRALVLPLAVALSGALLGALLAVAALAPAACLSPGDTALGRDWALIAAVLAGALAALGLGCAIGLALLRALDTAIDRGWLSELSANAAAGVLFIAGLLALTADGARATPGWQLTVFALWALAFLATYAGVLAATPWPRTGRRLLVLRVFARGGRAERLLDALQTRWRLAGPVLQIGGPDLVRLNLDLHELLHLAGARLHELFQPAAAGRERLLAQLALAPDREGRFRVNELFCFDTSWRQSLEALLSLSDAVLLDLRGFTAARGGTAWEVSRLGTLGLLPRVVALHDSRTDWAAFDAAVGQAGAADRLAARIEAGARGSEDQAFDALLAVAAQGHGR